MSKISESVEAALRQFNDDHSGWMNGLDDEDWTALADCAIDAVRSALFPGDAVRAVYPWRTNADLLYDVWRLGYVEGFVYDITPGAGGLWSKRLQIPGGYVDGIEQILLNIKKTDFRKTSFDDRTWDTVFYDAPYKLNGNPDGLPELSKRYGVDVPTTINERHTLMIQGLAECIRISRRYILVKCQDQVANGKVHWQTRMLANFAAGGIVLDPATENGWRAVPRARQIDRFDMLGHHIPQPMGPSERYPQGRAQKHAHGRPSTLLVFERQEEDR